MLNQETFGSRLKARRLELRIKQKDLAEHIEQTQPYVTQLEQDVVYLPQSIESLADYLRTYPETLLWGRIPIEKFTRRQQRLIKIVQQVPPAEQQRILEFARDLLSKKSTDTDA